MKQVPKSINKVDDKFLKRKGIDAHELKETTWVEVLVFQNMISMWIRKQEDFGFT